MKRIIILFIFLFFAFFIGKTINAEVPNSIDKANLNLKMFPIADMPITPQGIFYSIVGHVYKEGSNDPFEGVTIEFSGGIGAVVTDSQGFYSID